MATQKQIDANRRNAKKAGRKPGTLNASTLDRIKVNKMFQQKVMNVAELLFQKKLHLAHGQTFLYKIEKYYQGTGKNRVLKRKKPKLVTEQWEIEQYLEGVIENGGMEDPEDTYYYITAKEPSNQAIEDLLDRGLGKVAQAIKTEDEEGNTQPITGLLIIKESSTKK